MGVKELGPLGNRTINHSIVYTPCLGRGCSDVCIVLCLVKISRHIKYAVNHHEATNHKSRTALLLSLTPTPVDIYIYKSQKVF